MFLAFFAERLSREVEHLRHLVGFRLHRFDIRSSRGSESELFEHLEGGLESRVSDLAPWIDDLSVRRVDDISSTLGDLSSRVLPFRQRRGEDRESCRILRAEDAHRLEALRKTLEDHRRVRIGSNRLEDFEITSERVRLIRSTGDEIGSAKLEDRRRSSRSAAFAHARILTSLAA